MNIVAPIPTSLVFPTANVNTEAARRDNVQREVIPPSSESDQSASKQGLGSESDRARSPGQLPPAITYERPQVQVSEQTAQPFQQAENGEAQPDNGQDQSAGKENAQQEQRDQQQVKQLKERDEEVRRHEEAHAARGGQYAGSPQYEYETGPDGKRYATGGEVSIDVSEASSPEKTIEKMQQVRAAALAPAEPSAQDYKVAREASQKETEARQSLAAENSIASPASADGRTSGIQAASGASRSPEINDELSARAGVIQQFYQASYSPRNAGFSASA